MPPRNDAEAPGMSVSAAATRPPVSDSATATLRPPACSRARICPASSYASSPADAARAACSPACADPELTTTIIPPHLAVPAGSPVRGRTGPAQPHRLQNIVDAGHQGDDNCRGHDQPAHDPGRTERRRQDIQADRDDLEQRLQLAATAGRRSAAADCPEPP